MSKDRGTKTPPRPAKKATPAARRQATEVQPMSPVGLIGAIVAALVVAAILLFVINTRLNAATPVAPAPQAAAPTVAAAVPTIPSAPAATSGDVTLTGGFTKGNPQAKVVFTEFADFQ